MDIIYRKAELSSGEAFFVDEFWHPKIDSWNPLYKDILELFDFNKYTCPRLPISMGLHAPDAMQACPSVLRLPIKYAFTDIRLPKELLPLQALLVRLLQYDKFINPRFEEFFAHVTIDNSTVEAGVTHRFGGFHGDGLQGGKFKKKLIVEHSYIFVSNHPTLFAMQPFFVAHLNEDRYNIFKEFDRQVRSESIYSGMEGHIYLIDPYMVHASPVINNSVNRTFFRLTITPTELLMPKNTVNPMFDGQEYPARIDVREFVSDPDVPVPYDFYGIQKANL
jgi:hypothetical protein